MKPGSDFYPNRQHRDGLGSYCRDCFKARTRKYQVAHRKRCQENVKNWYNKHKNDPEYRAKKLENWKAWAANNREHVNAKRRELHKTNPARFKRRNARRQANPEQNIASRMRSRINNAIRKRDLPGEAAKNGRAWEALVGYTKADLFVHIERQFVRGMSWGNFGKWHIDHILPVSSFQFASVDDPEFRACWALTNLRPEWAKQNISKGAKRVTLL